MPEKNGRGQSTNTWEIQNLDTDVQRLVVNGEKQTLARAPNSGYFIPPVLSESPDRLHFNKGEIRQWKEMDGNRVFMLLRWHHGDNSITSVDEKSGTALLSEPE